MKILSLLLLLTLSLFGDFDYRVENTNFTISQGSINPQQNTNYLYNYDRLRFRGDYSYENYFSTIIADGVNYLGKEYTESNDFNYIKWQQSDTPFKTQTAFHDYDKGSAYAKLYRLYGGYEDSQNRVVLGLQNISMGVGRIWTPTNLFNPKNIYALEPDETFGVAALLYTRHLSDTSEITLITSQKEDESFKYAARYTAFLDFSEIAIDMLSSNETTMIGLELEANLADSGVEVRSEVAYIRNSFNNPLNTTQEIAFTQAIVGADYGFENGVTLIGEALYSSESFTYNELLLNLDSEILPNLVYSKFYTALSLSYSFNIFLDGSLIYIESFNDKNSRFVSPTLNYTLNDYNSFMLGAMMQDGERGSEFGELKNSYYFKWLLSF
ncbi:MAG: hypothetical protein U9Q40_09015 [Campylobacterota bacterium]|nr:hypothetical protein [Campylobacterota bacterium]